ncbi:unnamed protein product [Dibothriocephalus latus]|uniref:Reverse transcriptase domain-containing protein n=1 Tax=Dibothriocephalus latus TaxID=60516 RepID=A0A3P7N2Y0_DIBLA|nr:unnamed protein product [Dibothriocephalus latus]
MIIAMITACYSSITALVLAQNNLSEPFASPSGIREGCFLSSILSIYTIDCILRKALRVDDVIELAPGRKLTELVYADDIALLFVKSIYGVTVADVDTLSCSLEPSLSIRRLCPTDSPARLTFGQTFDLKLNVADTNINMHNASLIVEKEACTDVDIALLSSLGSEGGVSMNSICWKSMVSVSSPEEMRLHGPLPARSTKGPRAPR